MMIEPSGKKEGLFDGVKWMRLLGPILLIFLIGSLDIQKVSEILFQSNILWIVLSILLIIPLFTLKTIRWQRLLKSQKISYPFSQALLTYFASLFIGLLTPGRLGEFTKVIYVRTDCNVNSGFALSSVLTDRLFDLYFMILWGVMAFLSLFYLEIAWVWLVIIMGVLVLPIFLFLNGKTYNFIKQNVEKLGKFGKKLFAEGGGLANLRSGLQQLRWQALFIGACLTGMAYGLYFGQCYFLAQAINFSASFTQISFAVSLGGLVTLLPVSIAGLGTREAAIVSYFGFFGIDSEIALSFSLLVFSNFYLFGSLFGFFAWWKKPLPCLFERA